MSTSSSQPIAVAAVHNDAALEDAGTGPHEPARHALPSPAPSIDPNALTSNGELLAALGAVLARDAPSLAPGGDALARLGELLSQTGNLHSNVREELASGAGKQPDRALALTADTTERLGAIISANGSNLAAAEQSADVLTRLAAAINGAERLEKNVRSEIAASQPAGAALNTDGNALAQGGDLLARLGGVLAKDAPALAPGADALTRLGAAVTHAGGLEKDLRSELGIGNIRIPRELPQHIDLDQDKLARGAQAVATPDGLSRGGETLSRLGALLAQDAPILAPGAEALGHLGAVLAGAGKLGGDVRDAVEAHHPGASQHLGGTLAQFGSFLHGAVKKHSNADRHMTASPTPLPMISEPTEVPQQQWNDRTLDGTRAPRPTRISLPMSTHERDLPALPTPARTASGATRTRPRSSFEIPGADEFARVPTRALSVDMPSVYRRNSDGRPTTSDGRDSIGARPVGLTTEQHRAYAQEKRTRETDAQSQRQTWAGSESGRARPAPAFGAGGGGDNNPESYRDVDRLLNEKREARFQMTLKERAEATLVEAKKARDKAAGKARRLGWTLNTAIGLQVIFGALTTGLGAALRGGGSSLSISVLGGGSTVIATYLAKVRGTDEPELSRLRVAALNHFIRELDAFILDHGSETGRHLDHELARFRTELEALLGKKPTSNNNGQNGGAGSGAAKDLQIWANGARPGLPAFDNSYGPSGPLLPTYVTGGGVPGQVFVHPQQQQQQQPQMAFAAPTGYVGQNAAYYAGSVTPTPGVSQLPQQQQQFMAGVQTGPMLAGAPPPPHLPGVGRAQSAPAAAWLGARTAPVGVGAGVRDAGYMV